MQTNRPYDWCEWQQPGTPWRKRAIYHITLTAAYHADVLGSLRIPDGDPEQAVIDPKSLGQAVKDCVWTIKKHHPDVAIWRVQLMDSHIHFIVHVERAMESSIKEVMRGFWQGCKAAARRASADDIRVIKDRHRPYDETQDIGGLVFPTQPHIRPMSRAGQLDTMFRYVDDNPKRKAFSYLHEGCYRVTEGVMIAGRRYAAVGNLLLLQEARRQTIHVHKEWVWDAERCGYDKPLRDYKNHCVLEARKGHMLTVSPCINEHEAQVRDVLLKEGLPMAIIMDNGFRPFYTPPTEWCQPVAEGRLLLLAPWPYIENKPTILRQEAVTLNGYADEIAAER